MTATPPSTSLIEATNFLTRPLSPIISYSTLNALQQILLSTFISLPIWHHHDTCLKLTFTSSTPPSAFFSACIATRVDWSDWFYALGGREFDLTIERTLVSLRAKGISGRVVIWKDKLSNDPTFLSPIPVLKPEPRFCTPTKTVNHSPRWVSPPPEAPRRTQHRTIAQQLLQSEHEMEEADEIFAMISNFNRSFIPTTPDTEYSTIQKPFPLSRLPTISSIDEKVFHSQFTSNKHTRFLDCVITIPSPISSPGSSRSSSPYSGYSSQESLIGVSVSSTTSRAQVTCHPLASVSQYAPSYSRHENGFQTDIATKTQVQRYLYQGGQSTVLTGGVMLGGASTNNTPIRRFGSKSQVAPPRMR